MVWGERTDFAGGEDNEGGRGDTKGEQKEDTNEAAAVKREDWMMAPPKEAGWLLGGRGKKQEIEEEPDPDNVCILFYFILLFYSFYFVLFCFVLFCFVLFCFVLFCFVLFCFVLFCFVLC